MANWWEQAPITRPAQSENWWESAPLADGGNSVPQTVQEKTAKALGLKDYAKRGTIVPLGETKDGKLELALPQIAVDLATSFMLPGHVAKGGSYTPEDATRMALDVAVPATMAKNPAGRAVSQTRKDIIDAAPSTEQLYAAGRPKFEAAKNSGTAISPDKYANFMADLETDLAKEGIAPMLHDKALAAFNQMGKRVGDAPDIADLQTIRRQIGVAERSTTPELADERRIAGIMRERLDDMIDSLTDADIVSGDISNVASQLKEARALWSKASKSEKIESIMEAAQLSASGYEKGLQNGFRQLLKNEKAVRGFSDDEIAAMKEVVNGTPTTKALRILGKLSFGTRGGSNWLGGTVGMAGGQGLFGPVGMAAAPIIGYVAQKGADASTSQAAQLARALAASGAAMPGTHRKLAEQLMKAAAPAAGTQIPRDSALGKALLRGDVL